MTPKDLNQLEKLLDKKFDENLKDFATKDEIELKIDEAVAVIITNVDKNKADKEYVSKLDERVKKIELELKAS